MLYAENTFISIFDGLAALEAKHEKALKYYDLSFYVSSLLYEGYIDQEVKIIHQSKWKQRTERCLEILFKEYSVTQDNKYINRAFSYVEESKARVLRERTSQKSLLELHSEDTLLQKNDQLKALQENYINRYIREQFNSANSKKLQTINDSLSNINLKLKAIQDQISLKYPDSQPELVSTQDVQKVMKRDDAFLILYFLGKDNLYRFEISSNEIQLYKIEVTEFLNQQILSFIGYFNDSRTINNDIVGFQDNSFSLFTSIMPETLPKGKNLLIIPDGLLHFVPFEALLTKSSQSLSYANMPFLTLGHAVGYYTSASLYYNTKTPQTDTSVLGIFPVFENTTKSLKYSIEESEQISKRMDSKLLMHEQARKKTFINLAQDYSVIHLSTHAYSGTFTIPATLEFYDEVMLLQELYSLDLNPKLVVLSACETGVGKIQTGEGPMSLARGFQYAGAQNLLFSLWEVNDLSTSQLMSSFYKDYSKTHSALKANRKSKLDFLKNSNISNANKSPYYWSAFVYYGAIDNHDQKTIPLWIFVITGLFILLVIAMRVKFKYKTLNFSRLFRKL
jgi:CHAT domain-containing protein